MGGLFRHHDWHGSAVNRQAFYLTGLHGSHKTVLLRAILTLRSVDFVGLQEELGKSVSMLRCLLGVQEVPPSVARA